jgi:hypothetical protein
LADEIECRIGEIMAAVKRFMQKIIQRLPLAHARQCKRWIQVKAAQPYGRSYNKRQHRRATRMLAAEGLDTDG